MTEQPPEAHEPEPMPEAAQPSQPAGPGSMPGPPPMPAAERVGLAAQQRGASDYAFSYWSALGWTVLTFGIYGFYVFYQLVRRMRDHNARGSNSSTRRPPWHGSRPEARACSRNWRLPSSGPPVSWPC